MSLGELEGREPLQPDLRLEAEQVQDDILECLVEAVMKVYALPDGYRLKVELGIAKFWNTKLSKDFREKCCNGTPQLRSDLYTEMTSLTNGERMNVILRVLNLATFEPFFMDHKYQIKETILAEAGLDVDAIAHIKRTMH